MMVSYQVRNWPPCATSALARANISGLPRIRSRPVAMPPRMPVAGRAVVAPQGSMLSAPITVTAEEAGVVQPTAQWLNPAFSLWSTSKEYRRPWTSATAAEVCVALVVHAEGAVIADVKAIRVALAGLASVESESCTSSLPATEKTCVPVNEGTMNPRTREPLESPTSCWSDCRLVIICRKAGGPA